MLDDFKLYFERSGGFAGMQLKVELNSSDLSNEEKEKLIGLIDTANFFEYKPDTSETKQIPDQFQYRISIETKDSANEIILSENQIPENWQPLIEYLNRKARMSRR